MASTDIPVLLFPLKLETRFVRNELWVRVYPDEILFDRHEPKLSSWELKAGQRYHAAADPKSAWRELSHRFGPARAAWIARQMSQQPTLPDSELHDTPLIKPPTLNGLPDRFEVFVYRGQELAYRQEIKPTSGIRTKPLTLHAPLPLGMQPGEALLSDLYDETSKWVIDFDEAVDQGLAVKVPLDRIDRYPNTASFSKVIAVGIKETTAEKGSQLLEELLDHHHYTNGLAFIAKDSPTNNTAKGKSGYSEFEDHDHAFQTEIADVDDWDAIRTNAHRLSNALGLIGEQRKVFQHIELSGNTSESFAGDINTALWPVTGDYFLRYMLSDTSSDVSLLDPDKLERVAKYAREFVRGSGPLPTLRVGHQPYSILPVTRFWTPEADWQSDNDQLSLHRFTAPWQASLRDHPSAAEDWRIFDTQFYSVLVELGKRWFTSATAATDSELGPLVPKITAESDDPDRDLLRVLAMEPISTSYWTRPLIDHSFINWCLTDLKDYVFDKDTFPGDPWAYALEWESLWKNLRTVNAKLLREISRALKTPFEETSLLKSLGWGEGQTLPIALIEDIEGDSLSTPSKYLQELVQNRFQENPDILLWDMLQRSLVLTKGIGTGELCRTAIRSIKDSLLDEHQSSLNKHTLERLFRESLDLCSHRLDAWITALATQRLSTMRQQPGQTQGIYLGAYGWVENLTRQGPPRSDGFIHAPSADHASAAAVLHNAFLTHQPVFDEQLLPNTANPFRINLTSDRVRQSRRILEGVRQGLPLGALLGFQFERTLHEQSLDQHIDEFRAAFPLVANKETLSETNDSETVEAIAARNVLDGLTLVRWRENPDPERTDITLGDVSALAAVHRILTDRSKLVVLKTIENLASIADAASDLYLHEAVYQAVKGNYERAGAAVEASSGNMALPELESIRTRGLSTSFENRVCLLFRKETPVSMGAEPRRRRRSLLESYSNALQPANEGPRAKAEPVLHVWFSDLLGDMRQISCAFEFEDNQRININSSLEKDLQKLPVIGRFAKQVIDYRKQYGYFNIEDLLNLPTWLAQLITHIEQRGELSPTELRDLAILRRLISTGNTWQLDTLRRAITLDQKALNLAHLGIDALDVLYMAAGSNSEEAAEFEQLISYYVRKAFGLHCDQPVKLDLMASMVGGPSIGEALELAQTVLNTLGGKGQQYATPDVFSLAEEADKAVFKQHHINELRTRLMTSLRDIAHLHSGLSDGSIPLTDGMLMAARFGICGVMPAGPRDSRLQVLKPTTVTELKRRLEESQALLQRADDALRPDPDTNNQKGTEQAISYLVQAMQTLFDIRQCSLDAQGMASNSDTDDRPFLVLPLFELQEADDFSLALSRQEDVLNGLGPERIRIWLEQAALTHSPLKDLEDLIIHAEAWPLTNNSPFNFHAIQLPFDHWMGLDDTERNIGRSLGREHQPRPKGSRSIVMLTPIQNQSVATPILVGDNPSLPPLNRVRQVPTYAGLFLDKWNEKIPDPKIDTSVAFNYNQPNAQAPQCLLLAVPGERKDEIEDWSHEALVDILLDTMDLYKIRAVDPDALRKVGTIFPALFLPTDPRMPGWARQDVYIESLEGWFKALVPDRCVEHDWAGEDGGTVRWLNDESKNKLDLCIKYQGDPASFPDIIELLSFNPEDWEQYWSDWEQYHSDLQKYHESSNNPYPTRPTFEAEIRVLGDISWEASQEEANLYTVSLRSDNEFKGFRCQFDATWEIRKICYP
jgi:hypothetical protein